MAFENNINDLKILFVLLIGVPLIASTNIDCSGKSFHCLNSTHFMICVDLGGGVSYTVDDFVIPCPPPTECKATNRFECEFPPSTTVAPMTVKPLAGTREIESTTEEYIIDAISVNTVPEQHLELSTVKVTQEPTTDASVIPLHSDAITLSDIMLEKVSESKIIRTEPSTIVLVESTNGNDSAPVTEPSIFPTPENFFDSSNHGFLGTTEIPTVDLKVEKNYSLDTNGTENIFEVITTTVSTSHANEALFEINAMNRNGTTQLEDVTMTSVDVVSANNESVQSTTRTPLSERAVPTTDDTLMVSDSRDKLSNHNNSIDVNIATGTVSGVTSLYIENVANHTFDTESPNIVLSETVTTLIPSVITTTSIETTTESSPTADAQTETVITHGLDSNIELMTTRPQDMTTDSAIVVQTTNSIVVAIEVADVSNSSFITDFGHFNVTLGPEGYEVTTEFVKSVTSINTTELPLVYEKTENTINNTDDLNIVGETTVYTTLFPSMTTVSYSENSTGSSKTPLEYISNDSILTSTGLIDIQTENTYVDIATTLPTESLNLNNIENNNKIVTLPPIDFTTKVDGIGTRIIGEITTTEDSTVHSIEQPIKSTLGFDVFSLPTELHINDIGTVNVTKTINAIQAISTTIAPSNGTKNKYIQSTEYKNIVNSSSEAVIDPYVPNKPSESSLDSLLFTTTPHQKLISMLTQPDIKQHTEVSDTVTEVIINTEPTQIKHQVSTGSRTVTVPYEFTDSILHLDSKKLPDIETTTNDLFFENYGDETVKVDNITNAVRVENIMNNTGASGIRTTVIPLSKDRVYAENELSGKNNIVYNSTKQTEKGSDGEPGLDQTSYTVEHQETLIIDNSESPQNISGISRTVLESNESMTPSSKPFFERNTNDLVPLPTTTITYEKTDVTSSLNDLTLSPKIHDIDEGNGITTLKTTYETNHVPSHSTTEVIISIRKTPENILINSLTTAQQENVTKSPLDYLPVESPRFPVTEIGETLIQPATEVVFNANSNGTTLQNYDFVTTVRSIYKLTEINPLENVLFNGSYSVKNTTNKINMLSKSNNTIPFQNNILIKNGQDILTQLPSTTEFQTNTTMTPIDTSITEMFVPQTSLKQVNSTKQNDNLNSLETNSSNMKDAIILPHGKMDQTSSAATNIEQNETGNAIRFDIVKQTSLVDNADQSNNANSTQKRVELTSPISTTEQGNITNKKVIITVSVAQTEKNNIPHYTENEGFYQFDVTAKARQSNPENLNNKRGQQSGSKANTEQSSVVTQNEGDQQSGSIGNTEQNNTENATQSEIIQQTGSLTVTEQSTFANATQNVEIQQTGLIPNTEQNYIITNINYTNITTTENARQYEVLENGSTATTGQSNSSNTTDRIKRTGLVSTSIQSIANETSKIGGIQKIDSIILFLQSHSTTSTKIGKTKQSPLVNNSNVIKSEDTAQIDSALSNLEDSTVADVIQAREVDQTSSIEQDKNNTVYNSGVQLNDLLAHSEQIITENAKKFGELEKRTSIAILEQTKAKNAVQSVEEVYTDLETNKGQNSTAVQIQTGSEHMLENTSAIEGDKQTGVRNGYKEQSDTKRAVKSSEDSQIGSVTNSEKNTASLKKHTVVAEPLRPVASSEQGIVQSGKSDQTLILANTELSFTTNQIPSAKEVTSNSITNSEQNFSTSATQSIGSDHTSFVDGSEQIKNPIFIISSVDEQHESITTTDQRNEETGNNITSSVLKIQNGIVTLSPERTTSTKILEVIKTTSSDTVGFSELTFTPLTSSGQNEKETHVTANPLAIDIMELESGKLKEKQADFNNSNVVNSDQSEIKDTFVGVPALQVTLNSQSEDASLSLPMITLSESTYPTTPLIILQREEAGIFTFATENIDDTVKVTSKLPSFNTNWNEHVATIQISDELHSTYTTQIIATESPSEEKNTFLNTMSNIGILLSNDNQDDTESTSSNIVNLSGYGQQNVNQNVGIDKINQTDSESAKFSIQPPILQPKEMAVNINLQKINTHTTLQVSEVTTKIIATEATTETQSEVSSDVMSGSSTTEKYVTTTTSSNEHTYNTTTVPEFDCQNRPTGKYADNNDCSKFYICSGISQPLAGSCPLNTVFSEIRKQCTRNLSHCIRNNEFKCSMPGRYADYLKPNIYYICIKEDKKFLRYKLKCQNGFLLNRLTVRCYQNAYTLSSSNSDSQSINEKISQEAVKKSNSNNKKKSFECEEAGKFADPYSCRGYYICKLRNDNKSDDSYRLKFKKCDSDEVFHKEKKKCVDASSYECRYSDKMISNVYFVQVRRNNHFYIFKLQCRNGYRLDTTRVRCEKKTEISSRSESSENSRSTNHNISRETKKLYKDDNNKRFECEEAGIFADPKDCRRYYTCKDQNSSERKFRRKRKRCGKHEVFNKDTRKCVYSRNYRCL